MKKLIIKNIDTIIAYLLILMALVMLFYLVYVIGYENGYNSANGLKIGLNLKSYCYEKV